MSLVMEFPLPMVGLAGGPLAAIIFVFFIGVLYGGFIILAALGALSGIVTAYLVSPPKQQQMLATVSVALTAVCLLVICSYVKMYGL